MRNILYNQNEKPKGPDEILKVTALIYLKEALDQERFEEAPGLIENAKEFGAKHREVRAIIGKYVRGLDPKRSSGVRRQKKNRRF